MNEVTFTQESSMCRDTLIKIKEIIGLIIEISFVFVFFTYVGKVLIYIYCYGTCDQSEKDKCACYNYVTNHSYWISFKYSILEAILAIIFYNIYNKLVS